jgi:Major capsid protein Gp23
MQYESMYEDMKLAGLRPEKPELPPESAKLIYETFPSQFGQLRCLDLVGVHPATGPCNILLIENGEVATSEWASQQKLVNAQEWGYNRSLNKWLEEKYGLRLDEPNLQSDYLKQVSYVVRSQVINRSAEERGTAEDYAALMDRVVVITMLHGALEGSWDALNGLEGAYVVCHPSVAHIVQKRSGLAPVCFDFVRPDAAYIGFKKSEYHASFYWMPYVPLQMVRYFDEKTFEAKVAYKTRYGMMGAAEWTWGSETWFPPAAGMEFVKVKLFP